MNMQNYTQAEYEETLKYLAQQAPRLRSCFKKTWLIAFESLKKQIAKKAKDGDLVKYECPSCETSLPDSLEVLYPYTEYRIRLRHCPKCGQRLCNLFGERC